MKCCRSQFFLVPDGSRARVDFAMARSLLCLFWLCFQARLWKALADPAKKRLRDEGSDASEEWGNYALGLYGRNILPATVAKRSLEKGRAAGAKRGYLRGKKGKKNAARTLRKEFKKTCWPQFYWAQIPI